LAAKRGSTGHAGERCRFRRIKNRICLSITFPARRALDPDDVAASVEHHVNVLRRHTDTQAREVLAATLRESGDHGATEVSVVAIGGDFNGDGQSLRPDNDGGG
ncbi:pectinesterase, partial [Sarracenia purpurea var. burkii]